VPSFKNYLWWYLHCVYVTFHISNRTILTQELIFFPISFHTTANVDPDTFPVGAYFKALLDIVDGINPNKMKVEGLASFCLGASMLSGTVVVTGYLTKA